MRKRAATRCSSACDTSLIKFMVLYVGLSDHDILVPLFIRTFSLRRSFQGRSHLRGIIERTNCSYIDPRYLKMFPVDTLASHHSIEHDGGHRTHLRKHYNKQVPELSVRSFWSTFLLQLLELLNRHLEKATHKICSLTLTSRKQQLRFSPQPLLE